MVAQGKKERHRIVFVCTIVDLDMQDPADVLLYLHRLLFASKTW